MKYLLIALVAVFPLAFLSAADNTTNSSPDIPLGGALGPSPADDAITLSKPVSRIVYQRDRHNRARVPVAGTCPTKARVVQARLVPRVAGQGIPTKWATISLSPDKGSFSGYIEGEGGWYRLDIRYKTGWFSRWQQGSGVDRVGIGEVFVVVGHSVAQGGDINLEGAADDRVSTVRLYSKQKRFDSLYLSTGDPQYLPEPQFSHAGDSVAHAPFGHGSYFWSKFGELLVKKENVPVLIFNAGFGGTSLEHWAKSAHGIQFEHGFVRSAIRMPYINLRNALTKYITITGIRALLADQGQNDAGEKDAAKIEEHYRIFVEQARQDLQYPELAVVVNRQSPGAAYPAVRIAQERMIPKPNYFVGPDYDFLVTEDRYDGIHLSESGMRKAAVMWAEALTPEFFRESRPWQPPVE